MSREIKFRAWKMHRGKLQRYVSTPFAALKYGQEHPDAPIIHGTVTNNIIDFMPDADIIEECTGLKDKNGKEIYEGDIVKLWSGELAELALGGSQYHLEHYPYTREVKIDSRGVYVEYPGYMYMLLRNFADITVIGNIHENPELLGDTNVGDTNVTNKEDQIKENKMNKMNKINLINKKSGIVTERIESISYTPKGNIMLMYVSDGLRELRSYSSLAELNEEWEDAPEETPRATMPYGDGVRTITLSNGLEVAMEDYYEIDEDSNKKTTFTWDEAMEIEKKTGGKWRVPTQTEWLYICSTMGNAKGELERDTLVTNLNLTTDEDDCGYYWSSTANTAAYAYYLDFNSSNVNPGTSSRYKYTGFTVRLLKEDNHV